MANPSLVIVWITIAVIIAVGVVLYLLFSPSQKIKRKFKKVPLKKIADCGYKKELVRIKGRLEFFDPPLLAPFSKDSCAYFEFAVQEQKHRGRGGSWREIVNHNNGVNFRVVDGTQKAVAQITFADVLLGNVKTQSFGVFMRPISQELESLVESYGTREKGHRRLICTEGILKQGEQVSIAGFCERRKIKDPITGVLSEEIVFASDNLFKLIVTNEPKLVAFE